jgi:hypothetical protein
VTPRVSAKGHAKGQQWLRKAPIGVEVTQCVSVIWVKWYEVESNPFYTNRTSRLEGPDPPARPPDLPPGRWSGGATCPGH